MKIYTRKGDSGETSLIGGSRVPKNHLRIEAYGTVDELNAFVGLIRDSAQDRSAEDTLVAIQHQLFTIGSELAAEKGHKMKLPELDQNSIDALEKAMDSMDQDLPALKNFILPGGDLTASHCHVARTICRRAERKVVALAAHESIDEQILRYINRLSDYFFILARFYTHRHNGQETPWLPNS